MHLADETWPALGEYFETESLALVPVGSTEQHGPHLPEGTDHMIAEAFAREVADRSGYLCDWLADQPFDDLMPRDHV